MNAIYSERRKEGNVFYKQRPSRRVWKGAMGLARLLNLDLWNF